MRATTRTPFLSGPLTLDEAVRSKVPVVDTAQNYGWDTNRGVVLESNNITSLHTYKEQIAARSVDFSFYQELSVSESKQGAVKQYFQEQKRTLLMGPTDPRCKHHTAGMAATARNQHATYTVDAITTWFADAVRTGRGLHVACCAGKWGQAL